MLQETIDYLIKSLLLLLSKLLQRLSSIREVVPVKKLIFSIPFAEIRHVRRTTFSDNANAFRDYKFYVANRDEYLFV